ncbi:MAG: Ppx/GppA family phosphatase [Clostridia bacterium]|nr:Ppx/GppA family phosphatase [Clostridia bacterium]
MHYSVIDIGSNSVRHLSAAVEDGKIEGDKRLIVTRLGEGVNETKRLTERAIRDTIAAIAEFKEEAVAHGAEAIYLMATSAVRDATNQADLLDGVRAATGLNIEVLSGEREAVVGCLGVQKGLAERKSILIVDIGGGSTEFIVFDDEIRHASSADVGAVRMTGKHIFNDPILEDEKQAVIEDVKAIIRPHLEAVLGYRFEEIVGIGGTATTFGAIDLEMAVYDRHKIHNHSVYLESVKAMNERFQSLDLEARKQIVGLEPKRADVITAGGLILQVVMEVLEQRYFRVSDYDNLEGFLAEKLGL